MSLTQEEKQYLIRGINALVTTSSLRSKASKKINDQLNIDQNIAILSDYLRKDFVASASAAGVKTISSAMVASDSDIANLQMYTGYKPNPVLDGDGISLDEYIKNMQLTLGNTGLTGLQSDTITAALVEVHQEISDLSDEVYTYIEKLNQEKTKITTATGESIARLNQQVAGLSASTSSSFFRLDQEISDLNSFTNTSVTMLDQKILELNVFMNKALDGVNKKIMKIAEAAGVPLSVSNVSTSEILGYEAYFIGGSIKNVTECYYNGKEYSLGNKVAEGFNSLLGKAKAEDDCSNWAYTKEDHYLTNGGIENCTAFLMPEMAYHECIKKLGTFIVEL